MGFESKTAPTGYGSVSLTATMGTLDLGAAWSQKTTYASGTEHAEDALVDTIETLHFQAENMGREVDKSIPIVISNLTASPCSSTVGTCSKGDTEGCTERLIGLAKEGHKITINADHYYQPKGVKDAKAKSKAACEQMRKAGITVNIKNE
jgi:hypothetical protein